MDCLVFTSVLLQDEKKKQKQKHSITENMDCSKLSLSLIAAISDISACISGVFFNKKMLSIVFVCELIPVGKFQSVQTLHSTSFVTCRCDRCTFCEMHARFGLRKGQIR